jgi:hypothetical protein
VLGDSICVAEAWPPAFPGSGSFLSQLPALEANIMTAIDVDAAATLVSFDRPLRELASQEAEAWRAWLIRHQLNALDIACPFEMVYRPATKRRLATVEIELLTRGKSVAFRSGKKISFSGALVPSLPATESRAVHIKGSRSDKSERVGRSGRSTHQCVVVGRPYDAPKPFHLAHEIPCVRAPNLRHGVAILHDVQRAHHMEAATSREVSGWAIVGNKGGRRH